MAFFDEVQRGVAEVADRVGGAVVGIGQRWGVGSGVVTGSGQVLTNAHNVGEEEVTVTFGDGRVETGRVLGADMEGDLAVISVETRDAKPIEWAEVGDGLSIGSPVFALSNPGGRGLRVTFGFVSGTERSFRGPRGRRIAGSLEHTAPLLPGSSGGPIVDANGRLLGLNTNRLGEGFYLALPADGELKDRAAGLARGESPSRPRLGIGVAPPWVARRLRGAVGLPKADGVLVRVVEDDSPAAKAGLQRGDLVVEAGGAQVKDLDGLYQAIDGLKPAGSLGLKVLRGVEEKTVKVQL